VDTGSFGPKPEAQMRRRPSRWLRKKLCKKLLLLFRSPADAEASLGESNLQGKGVWVLEQANIDIGKALAVESRRHTDEVRMNQLIGQIDELLWELEGLNLQDRHVVPDELLPRITMVVAAATESDPPRADEVREPLVALDRLFEAQGRLTKLKCERQGFEVLDWDDGEELVPVPWVGRRRPR
jgi:hypothetical protein